MTFTQKDQWKVERSPREMHWFARHDRSQQWYSQLRRGSVHEKVELPSQLPPLSHSQLLQPICDNIILNLKNETEKMTYKNAVLKFKVAIRKELYFFSWLIRTG